MMNTPVRYGRTTPADTNALRRRHDGCQQLLPPQGAATMWALITTAMISPVTIDGSRSAQRPGEGR